MKILPQYSGFLITCQNAFLLHFNPFSLASFHICSVLKVPFAISSKLQRMIVASGSFTLLNAGIGTNINAFNRGDFMSLYISGENLADVTYQSHLSRLKYASENPVTGRMGVFNMGRNVSVKLIMNF